MDSSQATSFKGLNTDKPLSMMEKIFLSKMERIRSGSLIVEFPSGARRAVIRGSSTPVLLQIKSTVFFRKLVLGGSVGFGEAYVDGDWETPDLSALLDLLAANSKELSSVQKNGFNFERMRNRIQHVLRRNNRSNSKRNIEEHYDLSNDFYQTFLDRSMTYSSAYFGDGANTLEEAQLDKLRRMLRLSRVQSGGRLLEIGSGWGSMALLAAGHRGCEVKTITLSNEQYDLARKRIERAGLSSQVNVALEDYRDQHEQYDAIVSCEMIEAVGHEYLDSYFEVIQRCLKPGARAVIQAITIPDERYAHYCNSCDWIQKHIFPGGHLPSPTALRHSFAKAGLKEVSMDGFGRDYAKTLQLWHFKFLEFADRVMDLGFDSRFMRKWSYYLSYCEAGFNNDLIDVQHLVIEKPE